MNDFSYRPYRNTKLVASVLALVAVAHLLLMAGADSVLSTIQGNLLGRKVITVEIFGDDKIRASAPPAELVKQKAVPASIPKNTEIPKQLLPRNTPPPTPKSAPENNSPASTDGKVPNNEATPASSQAPETERPIITVESVELKKQATAPAETVASDAVINQSIGEVVPELMASELPKVGVLKAPQNYVFDVFQGEASDAKSVGRITFDLEVNELVYKSRFAVRFNWVARLIAEDRAWISQGRIDNNGLQPQRVVEQRGKREPKVITLDHEKALGKFSENQFPIQRGLQDRTSIIWQFGLLARSNPDKYARGTEFDFPLLVSSKMVASKWRSKQETIAVAGRSVEAIHFVRVDQRDDDVRFEFWLSSEFDMAPVKLTISDGKGRKFDVVREKLS